MKHRKSLIFILNLEFLLKCITTIIPRLNKLLENKTLKTNVTTCKKKKKMEDMLAFENINSEMYINIKLVNTDSLKVFSKSYN